VVVEEVLAARGSASREAGTRMLVSAVEVIGTIYGGHRELKAIDEAQRLLAEAATATVDQDIGPGPILGQCCGVALGTGPPETCWMEDLRPLAAATDRLAHAAASGPADPGA